MLIHDNTIQTIIFKKNVYKTFFFLRKKNNMKIVNKLTAYFVRFKFGIVDNTVVVFACNTF